MKDQDAIQAIEAIDAMVMRFEIDAMDEASIRRIASLLEVIVDRAKSSTDVYIKVRELKDWIDVLSDSTKHERFGGFLRARELTRHSCAALRNTLIRLHGPA